MKLNANFKKKEWKGERRKVSYGCFWLVRKISSSFLPTSQQIPMRRESLKMSQLSQSHNHVTLLSPSQVFQRHAVQDLTESDAERAKCLLRSGEFISFNAFIFRLNLLFAGSYNTTLLLMALEMITLDWWDLLRLLNEIVNWSTRSAGEELQQTSRAEIIP